MTFDDAFVIFLALEWITGSALALREIGKSGYVWVRFSIPPEDRRPLDLRRLRAHTLETLAWLFASGFFAWIPLAPVYTAYKMVHAYRKLSSAFVGR